MAHTPDQLAGLPIELRSHSADHFDLSALKGKEVLVVGAGQSATETAAILREEGVSVRLLARATSLLWHPPPSMVHKSKFERLRNPRTRRLGDGRDMWVYDNLPGLFHYLSQRVRLPDGCGGAWSLWSMVAKRSSCRAASNTLRLPYPWCRGTGYERLCCKVADRDRASSKA